MIPDFFVSIGVRRRCLPCLQSVLGGDCTILTIFVEVK